MPRSLSLLLFIPYYLCLASFDIGFKDDSDLTHFVTRPDIKAPLYEVHEYDAESVEPGYWFIGPYASIMQESHARNYYQPCQTGPHIYDRSGELVWSGACMVRNQNTCDFRVFEANGSSYLSAILYSYGTDAKGHAIILDSSYNIVRNVSAPTTIDNFNMHEFNVLDNGTRALHLLYRPDYVDVTELGVEQEAGWIGNIGIREVAVNTGATVFEWWATDHVSLRESNVKVDSLKGPPPTAWNWMHGNSIDKSANGDYLFSARFTDCIYKISGKDGSILWRLGGTNSSFSLNGFNFSRQHDARWLSQDEEKETISFLDNASDYSSNTSTISSALIVELDKTTEPMTAKVLRRWDRPDQKLSRLRGNSQILPNGNAFIGWSDNSYITEHSADGRLLLDARFQSTRFVTYRAWKFNFTGMPAEPPVMKAFVYGSSPETAVTAYYVSWNGATEVATWRFLRYNNETSETSIIGETKRTGFETMFYSNGYEPLTVAQAVSADGIVLGSSDHFVLRPQADWSMPKNSEGQSDAVKSSVICTEDCDEEGLHEPDIASSFKTEL